MRSDNDKVRMVLQNNTRIHETTSRFCTEVEVLAAFGVRFCKRLCRLSLRACSNDANKFCASVSEIKFALNVSRRSVARGTFGPKREMALRALKFMSGGGG